MCLVIPNICLESDVSFLRMENAGVYRSSCVMSRGCVPALDSLVSALEQGQGDLGMCLGHAEVGSGGTMCRLCIC